MDPLKTQSWQVYNTFTYYDEPDINFMQGYMGYHQATTKYPEVNACDDHVDGYWGRDWQGNLIDSDTYIRHHRMPYYAREANATYTKRLGIKFRMTENYPHADIVGHYYVAGDRTFDKTILDKGFLAPLSGNNAADEDSPISDFLVYKQPRRGLHLPTTLIPFIPEDLQSKIPYYAYISANTLFNESFPKGSYMTIEKFYHDADIDIYNDDSSEQTVARNSRYDQYIKVNSAHLQHRQWDAPSSVNHKIIDQQLLPKSTENDTSNGVILNIQEIWDVALNYSINSTVGLIELDRIPKNHEDYSGLLSEFFSDGNGLSVSIKIDADVFNNLYNIQYRRIGQNMWKKGLSTLNSFLYDGDIFISNLNVTDYW